MNWTQEETPRATPFLLKHDDFRLTVDATSKRIWQHFSLTFGVFREATECKATWPREAIAEARRRIDEFEAAINQNEGKQEDDE